MLQRRTFSDHARILRQKILGAIAGRAGGEGRPSYAINVANLAAATIFFRLRQSSRHTPGAVADLAYDA